MEACKALGQTRFYLGEFVGAATHLEEALRLYNPEQHRSHTLLYGVDPAVGAGVYAAWTLWCLGHLDQSLTRSHEALGLARQMMAHHQTQAVALRLAPLHLLRRDVQLTEELSEALMALSTEQDFAYWPRVAMVMRGWVLAEQGQGEAGITELRSAMASIRAIGTAAELPWYLALLAGAHATVGRTAEGLDAIAEALALVASMKESASTKRIFTASKASYYSRRVDLIPGLKPKLLPPSSRHFPGAKREIVGAARGDQPRPAVARSGPARRGP